MRAQNSENMEKKQETIRAAIASLEAAERSESYKYLKALVQDRIERTDGSMRTTVDSSFLQRLQGRKEGLEEASAIVEERLRELRGRLEAIEERMDRSEEEEDPLGAH